MTDNGTANGRPRGYGGRRLLFDVLGLTNIAAIVVSDIRQFPNAGTGFKVYTFIVVLVVTTIWLVLRRYEHPVWMMALLQLALLGHIAGRTVVVGDTELYRTHLLGLRTDKIIHAFNSLVGAAYLTALFRRNGLVLRGWEGFVVVMVACGVGAAVEIIEYFGVLLLPVTYVGDYANNVQDLIGNLVGATAGWALAFAAAKALPVRDGR